ncbi:MAG: ectoine synthase [Rhizobiaceae bacterium]
MIVKTLEDVSGTKGEMHGNKWHSMRLLHAEDGMGVTLTDSILEEGFEMILWQKNHLEACYCLEGEGTVEELETGVVHEIKPGTLYAMNNHDRHRIKAKTQMRVVCTFVPALTGMEKHDADGSL